MISDSASMVSHDIKGYIAHKVIQPKYLTVVRVISPIASYIAYNMLVLYTWNGPELTLSLREDPTVDLTVSLG